VFAYANVIVLFVPAVLFLLRALCSPWLDFRA
jgi:hypothetical protein